MGQVDILGPNPIKVGLNIKLGQNNYQQNIQKMYGILLPERIGK